ncbi:hypothetical protein ABZ318_30700 [Streptomyces sp. NPDC006197]
MLADGGIRSVLPPPLPTYGKTLGFVQFFRAGSRTVFDQDDLP